MMKMYVTAHGMTLVGKASEIQAKLQESMHQFKTVKEWHENSLATKTK